MHCILHPSLKMNLVFEHLQCKDNIEEMLFALQVA